MKRSGWVSRSRTVNWLTRSGPTPRWRLLLRNSIRCSSNSNLTRPCQNTRAIFVWACFLRTFRTLRWKALLFRRRRWRRSTGSGMKRRKSTTLHSASTKVASEIKASPEELKAYFEKNKAFFPAPESRSVQLIVADQVKVGQSIQVSDTQVQSFYNSHKDQFCTKERVKARHILVSILNKPAAEVPKLKAKAEDLLKQIKAGADFAKMAQENSDDKSNASKGGDLGWVMRGQMVPEFEKATFALKTNQISDVVTTNYGFHIVQVLEKEDAHLRPLDEVRAEIVTSLKSQTLNERMQALADQAHAELVKAPQNAQQIANKLGLLFITVDKFKAGDTVPELGADPQVGGAIASMQKGAVSQVMQSGEKLAIAVVTNVNPPHPAEFAEAEVAVRNRYGQERGVALATEKANKAAEIAKANGGDLKAAAKAVGL